MLSGVIEGFYGKAWTPAERETMLDWIESAGMNCFIYAPKDDVHVRARWRVPYDQAMCKGLVNLNTAARKRGITFFVAIAPCLDITYSDPAELTALTARIDQLLALGIRDFVLLFDDIPSALPIKDVPHFKSFAAAQAHVANAIHAHLSVRDGGQLLFCPTEYCERFADGDVATSEYLRTLGETLAPEIGVFWTGPEIVSEKITASHMKAVADVLGRKPVIWDNFHVNDYDVRRIHLGPLGGRERGVLKHVAGYVINPNNECAANFVPVATTGQFLTDPHYTPESATEEAIAAWRCAFAPAFGPHRETLPAADIALLVSLFYQPFACGPAIEEALARLRRMLGARWPDPMGKQWQGDLCAMRDLRDQIVMVFESLTEIGDRNLFHALHPYLWEAREEITHMVSYLEWLDEGPGPDDVFPGQDRIYNFYRRGFSAAIQELLRRDSSGRYFHEL
ncbi:beta-N-acetylglucosaminidase domain-containing protein [Pelagibacterium xiamenense]|uniref:beta-N-acetylglucosaminidase domain-containing protein n=1 Tax=Pelagibacterium xiamenense TaxID=2901140 RepID=UPI001E5AF09A|nr:beta-N-acetylglucosaminidase domain-containing protein [Pelagibacterium xiamenense]MCD7058779.1 protein O-GlcNAcase [Pelagibacterium xiamenense]